MEIRLSRCSAFLSNCFEKIFKFLQIILPKMKRKTVLTVNGTDFISRLGAPTYALITIPKFKLNKNFFYINKMVISNGY